jgi:outer membrane lipoprotein-sorting protein
MRYLTEHPRARWIAPTAAVVLVAGASVVTSQATADPTLPPRTAEQLLVDLQESELTPMSGTVVQTSNLGLPELPGLGGRGNGPGHQRSADFGALVSGTHTLRVWYDGPERARIALVGIGGESDLIRNDRDLWVWSSTEEEAVHYTLPEHEEEMTPPSPADLPLTPEEAAEEVLDRLDPTTAVTTDGTATVAGRPAYELVLEPKATDSLVRDVRIAIDAEESIPLRVQVHSTKVGDPAFEVGFTDVDLTAPEPRMFEFTPPPGTNVIEGGAGDHDSAPKPELDRRGPASKPTIVGSGWSSVAIAEVPQETGDSAGDDTLVRVLESLPRVSGDWGRGHLLTGTLFSAVLTDDGRLAIGLVAPEALYAALSSS